MFHSKPLAISDIAQCPGIIYLVSGQKIREKAKRNKLLRLLILCGYGECNARLLPGGQASQQPHCGAMATYSIFSRGTIDDGCLFVGLQCVRFFKSDIKKTTFLFFFFFNYQCLYLKITLQTDLWGNAAPSFKGKFAFLHTEELFFVICFSVGALQGPFLILSFKMV